MLKQEGYDLMGAAFEVYNVLGYGMSEEIYQQSLEIELSLRNIAYQSKVDIVVVYKDQTLATVYRPVNYSTTCGSLKRKLATSSTLALPKNLNGNGLLSRAKISVDYCGFCTAK